MSSALTRLPGSTIRRLSRPAMGARTSRPFQIEPGQVAVGLGELQVGLGFLVSRTRTGRALPG